jgi:hypothetical protein
MATLIEQAEQAWRTYLSTHADEIKHGVLSVEAMAEAYVSGFYAGVVQSDADHRQVCRGDRDKSDDR